jgi:predicted small metal-binding protein
MSETKAASPRLVVRCECGFVARGVEDEVVEALSRHAGEMHNMRVTREQVLARAERS